MAQMRSADRICVAENPLEASDRPYQAVRSKDWINLKSRKHPAMKLVVERSFTQMNGMLDLGQRREGPARKASNGSAVRRDAQVSVAFLSQRWRTLMLRRVLILSAAATMLLVTTFHSDDAFARRGGGMRAGGFHGGGAMRAGGYRGGAVAARGYRGGAVAVRGGRVAGGYRGAYRAGAYRGYGVGAAAVGAAAVGAAAAGAAYYGSYGSYNNCYDAYGNWVCPGQYPY